MTPNAGTDDTTEGLTPSQCESVPTVGEATVVNPDSDACGTEQITDRDLLEASPSGGYRTVYRIMEVAL